MNLFQSRTVVLVGLLTAMVLFPGEAHVSGTVQVSARSEMVYVQVGQGLRFHRGSSEQISAAEKSNQKRLAGAKEKAEKLAARIRQDLTAWQQIQTPAIPFKPIAEKLFDSASLQPTDVRFNDDPMVIVRFASTPDEKVRQAVAAVVQKAIAQTLPPE